MNNSSQQPYKGLTPYEERDKDNFFGRAEDIRILVDKIRARKLTFLFAASGVGKSSLLQAGVIPELKQPTHSFYAPLDVIYLRDWVEKPLETFKQKVLDYFQRDGRLTPDAHQQASVVLKDFLNFCTLLSSDPLVIILDQFEEFFYYQRYQEEFQPFIEQLSLAIHDSETATVFVISMREDFALELNAFKEYMPTFLIENFYRLEKLTEVQAKEAIVAPVTRLGFEYQPELLAALWTDLSRREQTERMGAEAVSGKEELRVEPPHLQIVCMQLWAHPETERTRVISLAIYVAQGRAEGLLNHYFRKTIQNFSRREKKLASAAFDLLVSRYGTKLARPLAELAATWRVAEAELGAVLKRLDEQRVLRQQDRQGKIWYELYHDVFAKHVYEWNEGYKRQQFIWRSLIRGGVVAVGLVGVVVGYDGWVNYTQVHLRLSPQSGVSDVIEVYQGRLGSFDFFGQQGYVYEMAYGRNDIEADKLFNRRPVGEIGSLNLEVVEQWPVRTRVAGYGELGEFGKAFCLAEATLSQGVDIDLSKRLVADLGDFRTGESFEWLRGRYRKESNVRAEVLESLAKMRPPFAKLLEAVKDEESGIRAAVATILGEIKDKRAIKLLIDLSKDSDEYVRRRAAEALGQLGSVEVVAPLIALLKDSDANVRDIVAWVLGQLGSVEAVAPLVALLLKDLDMDVRRRAAEALEKLGSVEAVAPLVPLLKDSNEDVRRRAAEALGQLGSVEAVAPLIALLKDSNEDVRRRAAEALGQLGSVEAVAPLVALLKDSNEYVRHRAAYALGQLGSVEAVAPLVALLKDSDEDLHRSAAETLRQLGSVKVVAPLVALLKDSNKAVRRRAAEALGQLGSVEAVAPLVTLLQDSDFYVHRSAAEALGQLGRVEAVTPLVTLLQEVIPYFRRSAAEALGQLGRVEAVTPLIALLKDSEQSVRNSAAFALGQLGRVEAVTPLVALLKDSDKDVRHRAAEALGELGSVEAVAPLIALLKDSDEDVRRRAAEALGELGSVEAVAPLVALLKDSDEDVRRSGAKALWRLGWRLGSPQKVKPEDIEKRKLSPAEESIRLLQTNILQQINTGQTSSVLPALTQLYSQLNNADNIYVQRAVVASLEEILRADKQPISQPMQEAMGTPATASKTVVISPVTVVKRELSSPPGPDYKADIQAKLAGIINDSEAVFGLRMDAVRAIMALGTKEVAQLVIHRLEQEQRDAGLNYFVLAASQVLGDNGYPTEAVRFLQPPLQNLTDRKQQWRNRRDKKTETVTDTLLACDKQQPQSIKEEENSWQLEWLEFELGYALARFDPEMGIQKLLWHSLTQVRQGAAAGLALVATGEWVATLIRQREEIKQAGIDSVDEAIFVQAAYRAMDEMLISLEETGTGEDLTVLQGVLKEVQDKAVQARVEWTIGRLKHLPLKQLRWWSIEPRTPSLKQQRESYYYRNFKRSVIKAQDVPPGMRVVHTPFGDRLVPE